MGWKSEEYLKVSRFREIRERRNSEPRKKNVNQPELNMRYNLNNILIG